MLEKVNKFHPDKLADRIAGAIVDHAYAQESAPKVAVEVLLGHGHAMVVIESSVTFDPVFVGDVVKSISGIDSLALIQAPQDPHLSRNQREGYKCGDNGVFSAKWNPEYEKATTLSKDLAEAFPFDGKYLFDFEKREATICQSNAKNVDIMAHNSLHQFENLSINPLGEWTGGTDTDAGCTNRKLGSDQPYCNPNGLHGKDLSKADVSVTIYINALSKEHNGAFVKAYCSIGDAEISIDIEGVGVKNVPFTDIVEFAHNYVKGLGGFEKFAEYGVI